LYVNVTNLRAPKKWQEFSLVLDLAETWPANLRLNSECFQLHVVPAVNATRQTARPIEFDGTMDRLLAQHPDRVSKFVPLAVQAVYKTTDEGLAPLELASVASGVESYEAVVEGRELERRAWIFPKLPNAFDEPESLVVDATWHQPDFSATRADELVPRLSGRFVEGVTWSSQGPLVPYVDSDLDQDRSTLLELLSFKSQRVFGVEEIRTLLRSLGVHRERMFSKFLSKLSAARVVDKPNSKHASGLRHVYILSFDDLTPSDVPRLDLFCSRLLEVLSAFSADEVVELVAHVPNLEKELRYV
jgi:type VI secretion system protein ImpG